MATDALVDLVDRTNSGLPLEFVERVVHEALREGGRGRVAVCVLLTGDEEIARLHGEHLGRHEPTDVMAFDLGDSIEVAVNVECARRVAHARGHTLRAEIALYVAHGLLHACGHDDHDVTARRRMRRAERRIMRALQLDYAPVDGDEPHAGEDEEEEEDTPRSPS